MEARFVLRCNSYSHNPGCILLPIFKMKGNFKDVFMENGKSLSFLFHLIAYPMFWWFWLFAKDKKYTPNHMMKELWKELK